MRKEFFRLIANSNPVHPSNRETSNVHVIIRNEVEEDEQEMRIRHLKSAWDAKFVKNGKQKF